MRNVLVADCRPCTGSSGLPCEESGPGWKQPLVLVTPRTVVAWHRAGFRLYWRRLSRARRGGRKPVSPEVQALIFRMAGENPTWGAPRIHGELLKLGFALSETGSLLLISVVRDGDTPIQTSRSPFDQTKHGYKVKEDTLQTSELRAFVSDAAVAVGIQLVAIGSKFEFFRTFRDRLRRSPELREQYNRLKRECADLDENRYRTIKSQFIESVLASEFE